jgi:hypothetical protein
MITNNLESANTMGEPKQWVAHITFNNNVTLVSELGRWVNVGLMGITEEQETKIRMRLGGLQFGKVTLRDVPSRLSPVQTRAIEFIESLRRSANETK